MKTLDVATEVCDRCRVHGRPRENSRGKLVHVYWTSGDLRMEGHCAAEALWLAVAAKRKAKA